MKKILLLLLAVFTFSPTFSVSAFSDAKTPLYIEMAYLIIRPSDEGTVTVMNMVNFKNMQQEPFKGDPKTKSVITVSMPEKATDVVVHDESLGAVITENNFYTTKEIPANQTIVVPYSYNIKKATSEEKLNLTFDYPIQQLQILIPEGQGSAKVDGVEYMDQGMFEFDGQNYQGYGVQNVEPAQPFTIMYFKDKNPEPVAKEQSAEAESGTEDSGTLGNITRSAPDFHNPGHIRMWNQSPVREFNPHILLIVLIVIFIAGISYYTYFLRKEKNEELRKQSDKEERAFQHLMDKRQAILDKVIELEESYNNGELTDSEYKEKSDAYKQHLVKVKMSLQEYID